MNYEEEYNHAFEIAKGYWGGVTDFVRGILESMFPQLAESEDEKITKEIVEFLDYCYDTNLFREEDYNNQYIWRRWLEKQKEQPQEELVYRMNGLMQEYIKEEKDDAEKEHRFKCYQLFWNALEDANFFEQKEQKPIEDVVKDIIKNKESAIKFLKSAGIMDDNGELAEMYRSEQKPTIWTEEDEKNLCELLAYGETRLGLRRWIAGLSEKIKGLQQKPAEWSEDDSRMLESALWHIKNSCGNGGKTSGEYEVYNWAKNLPNRFNPQPKSEWSEEDEDAIQQAILALEDRYDEYEPNLCFLGYKLPFNKAAERLKSLRPVKQEWSEEDEKMLEAFLHKLEVCDLLTNKENVWIVKKLKSLRPSWKPSEEQMRYLLAVINDPNNIGAESCYMAIKSLYNDLKKLL